MTDHFSYLYEDDAGDFFQKQACEAADEALPRADEIVKTASAPTADAYSFEKVAARLEQDLFILKTAGPCGIDMGMNKRAAVYMDHIIDECDMDVEQFDSLFDKVAAEAIQTDLAAAKAELYKLAGDDIILQAAIDEEINFIGFNMAKLANMEKEALIGAARAMLAAGRAGGKSALRRAGTAIRKAPGQATRATGRAVAAPFKGVARAGRGIASKYRQARIGLAERRLSSTNRALKGGFARKGTEGSKAFRKSLQETRGKAQGNLGKLMKDPKYQAAAQTRRTSAKARKAKQGAKADKSKADMAADAKKGQEGAGAAANLPKDPKVNTPAKTKDPSKTKDKASNDQKSPGKDSERAAGETADGAGVTLSGSAKKMRDSGWGSLSGEEKQKLINAGVVGAVGHRMIMGKGAITGGEGIV